jgi:hypothetical protein
LSIGINYIFTLFCNLNTGACWVLMIVHLWGDFYGFHYTTQIWQELCTHKIVPSEFFNAALWHCCCYKRHYFLFWYAYGQLHKWTDRRLLEVDWNRNFQASTRNLLGKRFPGFVSGSLLLELLVTSNSWFCAKLPCLFTGSCWL